MRQVLDTGADIIYPVIWSHQTFLCLAMIEKHMRPPYDEYVPYTLQPHLLLDQRHRAWELTVRYFTECITRYRHEKQIIAWELPNEMSHKTDLNYIKLIRGVKGIGGISFHYYNTEKFVKTSVRHWGWLDDRNAAPLVDLYADISDEMNLPVYIGECGQREPTPDKTGDDSVFIRNGWAQRGDAV